MKTILLFIFTLISSVAFAQHYFNAPVTGTAGASTQVLAANTLRSYLIIQNTGTTIIIAKFGSTISSSNEGIQIPGGGNYELNIAPASSLYLKALSGSPTYTVIQGN